ncbi:PhzF family phenazine biosynthesis protein [Spirosoma taeanense]|uniref:PhzF family phenazine biosynthesis protein n=1 Tax=Spirosoma taeanense TaxID=2735870 RepID=A0A6M5Y718_9BACT|nr:PhzF family phenazine biosynthesis protein [Spirosoma taeanense]QJW89206.1 PhzF family phenazine biosynthesis protein [Spirosoma taeanense]
MQFPFHLVDVFAEAKYQGNQLAVVEHDGELTSEQMLAIAREINFAETTFVDRRTLQDTAVAVRIFTPDQELPFAGHPTLGTAYVIREALLKTSPRQIVLKLGVGNIPVDFGEDGVLWMEQKQPTFGQTYAHADVADFLGIQPGNLMMNLPVEEVSTGIMFQIVPVQSRAILNTLQPDAGKFLDFLKHHDRHVGTNRLGCLVFTTETYEPQHDLNCRMFYPMNATVLEDSATGSANGCLLAYLLKHRVLDSTELQLRVEQGYAIPRPSLLYHDGRLGPDGRYQLRIGGRVQPVATGLWTA